MDKLLTNPSLEPVFGIHAVASCLQQKPTDVMEIWVQEGRQDTRFNRLLQQAEQHKIAVITVPRRQLDQTVKGQHQGIIAMCQPRKLLQEKQLMEHLGSLAHAPLLLVLDGITDPHNLGACLRTADAAGVDAVIVPKDKAVGINQTVSKVACGAAESMAFYQVTNLARCLKQLQQEGIWLIGTAEEAPKSIYQTELTGPIALVMGNEGKGLRRLTREGCDLLVNIPMAGQVESLNVSVATGVCLFEAVRQGR